MRSPLSAALCCAGASAAAPEPTDSAQAKAKLAAVRARIAALTNRLGDELKQRDALSARLRETELVITAKRRRLDELHAEQAAAERRRSELRAEQLLRSECPASGAAALAKQVQAAYMIGRQEQLKLLLNQSNPAGLGRTLTYYGYFAAERSAQDRHHPGTGPAACCSWCGDRATKRAAKDAGEAMRTGRWPDWNMRAPNRADTWRHSAHQVASGNQEFAKLQREEQAVESLVADLARVLQDFPVDSTQSFEHMRGKLPWPVQGRVTARYQEQQRGRRPACAGTAK